MKKIVKTISLTLIAIVFSVSVALAGLTVDAAKSQGLVGERPDGLLGIVSSQASEELQTLVSITNEERIIRYQAVAAKNGIDIEQVKVLTGKKLISATAKGEYFMDASGNWQRK